MSPTLSPESCVTVLRWKPDHCSFPRKTRPLWESASLLRCVWDDKNSAAIKFGWLTIRKIPKHTVTVGQHTAEIQYTQGMRSTLFIPVGILNTHLKEVMLGVWKSSYEGFSWSENISHVGPKGKEVPLLVPLHTKREFVVNGVTISWGVAHICPSVCLQNNLERTTFGLCSGPEGLWPVSFQRS